MKVLIVDDSEIVADRLAGLLSEVSGEIHLIGHIQDSSEAVEAVRRHAPDVVILDIHMQGKSGIDVLEEMRKQGLAPVVIILTNYPFPQYRERCMQAGADYFFDKSTQFDQAAEVLLDMVRRRIRPGGGDRN